MFLNRFSLRTIYRTILGCLVLLFTLHIQAEAIIGLPFFDDNEETEQWQSEHSGVKMAFLKTLSAKSPHIFVTYRIWHSFISAWQHSLEIIQNSGFNNEPTKEFSVSNKHIYRYNIYGDRQYIGNTDEFCGLNNAVGIPEMFVFDPDEWELYDTHVGLYYLHKKDEPIIGINTHDFTRINNPLYPTHETWLDHWTDGLHYLFDVQGWQNYFSVNPGKKFVYLHGHGSKRSYFHYLNEYACGLPAKRFAKLVKFFNDEMPIDVLGIHSCYWTSQRVLELMQREFDYDRLNFAVISLLTTEEPTYSISLPLIDRFNPFTQEIQFNSSRHVFYDALKQATHFYQGNMTPQIKQIINNTDDLYTERSNRQQASIVNTGDIQAQTIRR